VRTYCGLLRRIALTLAARTQAKQRTIKLRLKYDIFQLRKRCAEVRSVFVCELTQFSVIFCFLPWSVLFSGVIDSNCKREKIIVGW
jgi:hypothetical protein